MGQRIKIGIERKEMCGWEPQNESRVAAAEGKGCKWSGVQNHKGRKGVHKRIERTEMNRYYCNLDLALLVRVLSVSRVVRLWGCTMRGAQQRMGMEVQGRLSCRVSHDPRTGWELNVLHKCQCPPPVGANHRGRLSLLWPIRFHISAY